MIKFDYGFAVDWMRKDLAIVIEEAKRNGSPVPITEIVDGYYSKVQEMGGNRWDSSSLIALLKKKNKFVTDTVPYYEDFVRDQKENLVNVK